MGLKSTRLPTRNGRRPRRDSGADALRALLDGSPLAIIELSGPKAAITGWSDRAERLFGWAAAEVLGKRLRETELVHPDDRAEVERTLLAVRRGERAVSKHRGVCKDGSIAHTEWYLSAGAHAKKGPGSVVAQILDVTPQVRVRDELLAANARARDELLAANARAAELVESIADGFVSIDREGRYTYVSHNAARMLGRTPESLLGRKLWDAYPETAAGPLRAACDRAWAEQEPVTCEQCIADGRWYEIFIYPSADVLSIQERDVTERKRAEGALRASELLLRTVLENIAESYAIYDDDRRYVYVNAVGVKLAGRPLEEWIGKRDEELWPESLTRRYLPQLQEVYATGEPLRFEVTMVSVLGVEFTKSVTYVPIKGARDEIQYVLSLTYDLTERKRIEDALVRADNRKNEFLAALSHELRNPLTPIRYSLFVLDRVAPGSDQAARAKAIIDRQVGHLTRIVDDLLDVTRITSGKLQLQQVLVNLGGVLRRTVEDHQSLFDASGLALDTRLGKKALLVQGDPARIAQVIGNLLQNAAKFTGRGGRVTVSLKEEAARGLAVLRVRDNGVGIRADVLARLFRPFEQGEDTIDRSGGGLGLGLALVKALVELHGGDVKAVSEGPGSGAELTVRFPLDRSGAVVAPAPAKGRSHARRVLIIEDNLDAAGSLREALQLGKHAVEVAYDGREGLRKARGFKPDVVLCDIGLPGMDGYGVARAFRSDKELRATYLVALTGYAQPADREKARVAGFDEHLAKPATVGKLREVLENAFVRG